MIVKRKTFEVEFETQFDKSKFLRSEFRYCREELLKLWRTFENTNYLKQKLEKARVDHLEFFEEAYNVRLPKRTLVAQRTEQNITAFQSSYPRVRSYSISRKGY